MINAVIAEQGEAQVIADAELQAIRDNPDITFGDLLNVLVKTAEIASALSYYIVHRVPSNGGASPMSEAEQIAKARGLVARVAAGRRQMLE